MNHLLRSLTGTVCAAALALSAVYAPSAQNVYDGGTITADKTAQWTAQEASSGYDLRIHGWENWETAAYMGFTLPDDFSPADVTSAELVLTTVSASNSGTAYLYTAEYSAFENGAQYEGSTAPEYDETETASFVSPVSSGEFSIDISDYIGSLDAGGKNIAFRLDVKSQNTNNSWVIGSCTNSADAPKLVINTGEDKSIIKNSRFSNGSRYWTISNPDAMTVEDGVLQASGSGYEAKLGQTVDVPNGTYDITAELTNTSTEGECYLYAKAQGHTMARTAVPRYESATKVTVPSVTVDNGKLDIGLYVNGDQTVTVDNFNITESASTAVPFLKGGEISKLTFVEDNGGKFYDENGNEGDALQIMAENGFNLARIRVLNNPGKGRGNGTYYLPDGYQDLDDCLSLAKRAKDKGMQIEFTFAYSDWWSDGGEQFPPNEWLDGASGLSGSSLASYYAGKIYDYTKEVLQKLVEQDTAPEFVSIGNEMQYGMCFGAYASNNGLYNNSTYIAQLANAGAKAVREVCPDAKIILHSDNGGKLSKRTSFKNALKNIDFDVIGVSYYPYYNSDVSIDTVVSEFASLINTYDKDVIIMETGYNWNELRGDGYEGQLQDSGYYQDIYGETQEGQRAFLTELYAKLKQVLGTRCIGDLYWDPVMLYDGGAYKIGWAIKESDDWADGNVVSNSTIFDFNGKAVKGQQAMKYNTNADDKLLVTGTISQNDSSSVAAKTQVSVKVNGEVYTVTTDKFGKYIAAVPYPADEKLEISAEGYQGRYYTDAPSSGVTVTGIDFPTERNDETPEKPTPPAEEPEKPTEPIQHTSTIFEGNKVKVSFKEPDRAAAVIIASYDDDGRLIGVRTDNVDADTVERSYEIDTANVSEMKVLLWDGVKNVEPIGRAERVSMK